MHGAEIAANPRAGCDLKTMPKHCPLRNRGRRRTLASQKRVATELKFLLAMAEHTSSWSTEGGGWEGSADSPFAGEPKALTRVGGPPTDPAYLWLPSAYRSGEKSFGLDTEILQIALWLARTLWVVGACAVMLASDIPAIVSPSLDCSAVACLALNPLFLVPCIEHCVACASIELHASCRAFCTCAGHLTTESCASFSRTRQHSTTHSKGANSDPGVT
eukprot:1184830-Rhodomonas_salina.2